MGLLPSDLTASAASVVERAQGCSGLLGPVLGEGCHGEKGVFSTNYECSIVQPLCKSLSL